MAAPPAPFDLADRTALVTGASQGIGRAIALALAEAGASVWVAGRDAARLEDVASRVRALDRRCDVAIFDLADAASIEAGLAPVIEGGGVDILVNNAGVTDDGLLVRMSDAQWERVVETNLTGTFRVTRALLKPMMKRRWGRVVTISSVVGQSGNPGQANYAASKAGLLGLTKALAREVASRAITVNAIAPGYVETAMTGALTKEQRETLLASVPAGRMGAPEDVAAGVVYLASPAAGYVTGQVLSINGGMYT